MSNFNFESFAMNAFNQARHNFSDFKNSQNWVVANSLFKCGSAKAHEFCQHIGIDPDGYGLAENDHSNDWISVDDTEKLPEENESVLVNVCGNELKFCFVDIGRYEFDENDNIVWSTNLGLDPDEEVTHFKPDVTPLTEISFSAITD